MKNEFGHIRSGDTSISAGKILDFSKGKRQYLNSQVEAVIYDLLGYGKKYFDNWLDSARARFVSYSQGVDINRPFISLFEGWYIINYRFHSDVSPVIEFYSVEYEDMVDENLYNILESLKHSYLSIYEIIWSQNHTLMLRDIFCENELMTFAESDKVNSYTVGTLLMARVITIDYVSLIVGKPIAISGEYKRYLFDEVNSARIYEGEADFRVFLRDFAEVPVGLLIDLDQGIIKNRIKYRCVEMTGNRHRLLVEKIVNDTCFSLLDRKEKWLKFIYNNGTGRFFRLYVGTDRIIAAAEVQDDLVFATDEINLMLGREGIGDWKEGYRLSWEEDAEDLLIEIMHDKYIEEWLATPSIDLENMTPLLAMKDIRGRVLLENLLNDMEIMELRASTRGGFALPTSEIRTKLGLDKDGVQREMLEPEAIAIKVKQNRSRQALSAYITGYNWVNQECEQVAIYLFDLYYSGAWDKNRLAWLLYIWNEFSTVYRPRVTKVNVWAAALEQALPPGGDRMKHVHIAPVPFDMSVLIVNRNSNLITGHLKRYPLTDELKPVCYPLWMEMDNREKVAVYRDVLQRLQVFAHSLKNTYPENQEKAKIEFDKDIDTGGMYWDEPTRNNWQEFFKLYFLLSFKDESFSTIANCFWENQAKRYPPHLKTAAFNLMMSFIGVYSVDPISPGTLIFEDLFTGLKHESYGRISRNVHKTVVPGTIVITRLLPLGERYWVDNPLYTLSVDMQAIFEANLHILMEQLVVNDTSDPDYLKKRGLLILKAYIKTVADVEQNAVNLLKQPLDIPWRIADKLDHQESCRLLTMNNRFQLLYVDGCRSSYLWIGANNQGYDWGYVLVEDGKLLLCSPPGKDENRFRKEIRRCFKVADIVVACRELKDNTNVIQDLTAKLVNDLSGFLSLYPEVMPLLFRPDDLPDKEEEWLQGMFLYKLSAIIMEKLQRKK